MVLILFNSYKRIISYDRAKLKKVGDFYALTWLIFAGLVTFYENPESQMKSRENSSIPCFTVGPGIVYLTEAI